MASQVVDLTGPTWEQYNDLKSKLVTAQRNCQKFYNDSRHAKLKATTVEKKGLEKEMQLRDRVGKQQIRLNEQDELVKRLTQENKLLKQENQEMQKGWQNVEKLLLERISEFHALEDVKNKLGKKNEMLENINDEQETEIDALRESVNILEEYIEVLKEFAKTGGIEILEISRQRIKYRYKNIISVFEKK